jgi:hypothetical protein
MVGGGTGITPTPLSMETPKRLIYAGFGTFGLRATAACYRRFEWRAG